MKNAIRNWLGISGIEASIATETKLRKMVGEAIGAALEGDADTDNEWWQYICYVAEKNTLQRALEKASVETATNVAKSEIEKRIGDEAFIDEIVARIQRKQLGA